MRRTWLLAGFAKWLSRTYNAAEAPATEAGPVAGGKTMTMSLRHNIAAVIMAAGLGSPVAVKAGFLDDAVHIVVAPIQAPVQLTQDVFRGAPPGQIIQNQVNINAAPPAHIAQQTINAVDRGHNIVAAIPRQIIGNTLGDDWLHGYDILTASQRVQFEIGMTSGRFLSACAQNVNNCNPVQLASMPVAAAMRDAYRVYVTYSYPLPPWVVAQLSAVVPPQVLGVARWAVGKTPDFTVPGFLNAAIVWAIAVMRLRWATL
jgi:hypothetical protein